MGIRTKLNQQRENTLSRIALRSRVQDLERRSLEQRLDAAVRRDESAIFAGQQWQCRDALFPKFAYKLQHYE